MLLDDKQKIKDLEVLCNYSKMAVDLDEGMEDSSSEIYQNYSMRTERGKVFYRSLSDEQLLTVLKDRALTLGHSPAQKEVFWVWRVYIKARFKKWPYALKTAGLSKSAGKNGKSLEEFFKERKEYEDCIKLIRNKAIEICRIPHPKELPQVLDYLKRTGKDWPDILNEAGIDRHFFREKAVYSVENLSDVEKKYLQAILSFAWKLGRPPLKKEIPEEMLQCLIPKCGSFRNLLYQIGLEPIERKKSISMRRKKKEGDSVKHRRVLEECYYQVLSKDPQFIKDVEVLKAWSQKEGRLPERKEIDSETRKRLQQTCGSWSNALRQLEYIK